MRREARSGARWRARRQQQEGLVLARQIEKVKERAFVECRGGNILDDQCAGGECCRHGGLLQRLCRNQPGTRRLRPHRSEVAFARARRAREHHRAVGPRGPGVDKRKRRGIGGAAQEILARKAFRMVKRKRELTRTGGHQDGFSPE